MKIFVNKDRALFPSFPAQAGNPWDVLAQVDEWIPRTSRGMTVVVLEGVWMIVSLVGLVKYVKGKKEIQVAE